MVRSGFSAEFFNRLSQLIAPRADVHRNLVPLAVASP